MVSIIVHSAALTRSVDVVDDIPIVQRTSTYTLDEIKSQGKYKLNSIATRCAT